MLGKLERRVAIVARWLIAIVLMGLGVALGEWAVYGEGAAALVFGTAGFVAFNLAGIVWLALTRD